jgi:hypothetical protein
MDKNQMGSMNCTPALTGFAQTATEITFPADKNQYRFVMTVYFIALPSICYVTHS